MDSGYNIINTDGYILHIRASGESDKILVILTKTHGIVHVFARSIRKETAKMRSMARPYSFVHLSIIQGRVFILKNIRIIDMFEDIWENETKYKAFVDLLKTVHTFIPIDSQNENEVFNVVNNAVNLFSKKSEETINNISIAVKLHILSELGYVDNTLLQKESIEELSNSMTDDMDKNKNMNELLNETIKHL